MPAAGAWPARCRFGAKRSNMWSPYSERRRHSRSTASSTFQQPSSRPNPKPLTREIVLRTYLHIQRVEDQPMADASRPEAPTASSPARKVPPGVLAGPITPTMLRLALPTIVVLVVQTLVGVAETYFVSFLGTDALAGVALVFPVLMLMQMMSNGGIGGGVSSAVARALGADRRADADALIWHAIVLACAFGLVFTAAAMLGGPILYRAMGGTGPTLTAALTYSGVVFAGAIPIWIAALLSSALRGAGNVNVPALVILSGAVILVPLSPALIFGWGPFPRLGVAGGGAAVVIYYLLAALALMLYLRSPRSLLKLRIAPLRGRLFKDILGVGLLSAIGTVQVNLTVTFVTA